MKIKRSRSRVEGFSYTSSIIQQKKIKCQSHLSDLFELFDFIEKKFDDYEKEKNLKKIYNKGLSEEISSFHSNIT